MSARSRQRWGKDIELVFLSPPVGLSWSELVLSSGKFSGSDRETFLVLLKVIGAGVALIFLLFVVLEF
jgi:hypothetical protein